MPSDLNARHYEGLWVKLGLLPGMEEEERVAFLTELHRRAHRETSRTGWCNMGLNGNDASFRLIVLVTKMLFIELRRLLGQQSYELRLALGAKRRDGSMEAMRLVREETIAKYSVQWACFISSLYRQRVQLLEDMLDQHDSATSTTAALDAASSATPAMPERLEVALCRLHTAVDVCLRREREGGFVEQSFQQADGGTRYGEDELGALLATVEDVLLAVVDQRFARAAFQPTSSHLHLHLLGLAFSPKQGLLLPTAFTPKVAPFVHGTRYLAFALLRRAVARRASPAGPCDRLAPHRVSKDSIWRAQREDADVSVEEGDEGEGDEEMDDEDEGDTEEGYSGGRARMEGLSRDSHSDMGGAYGQPHLALVRTWVPFLLSCLG